MVPTLNVRYQLVPSQGSQMAVKQVVKSRADRAKEATVRQLPFRRSWSKASRSRSQPGARASKHELYAHFRSKQASSSVRNDGRMQPDWPATSSAGAPTRLTI